MLNICLLALFYLIQLDFFLYYMEVNVYRSGIYFLFALICGIFTFLNGCQMQVTYRAKTEEQCTREDLEVKGNEVLFSFEMHNEC